MTQNRLQFTLLGTGSSGGVPRIGNDWGLCDPLNSKNRRRRCALLVRRLDATIEQATNVLVDAGADMREQMLSEDVSELHGVLLTHPHADHIFGLDDLRQMAITLRRSIDVHMDDDTSRRVMQSFEYCFYQRPGTNYPAFCTEKRIKHSETVQVAGPSGDISAQPLLAEHGDIHSLGFRFGDVVYLPDVKRITDANSLDHLKDVRVLIIDALRYKPHPSHMCLEETLAFIEDIQPDRAVLTNMHCDLDYDTLRESLPHGVEPGYDGLTFE